MGKNTALEENYSPFLKLLIKIKEANKEKDEKRFKDAIEKVKVILGEPILNVLVDKEGSDEEIENSIYMVNFLLDCIHKNDTEYFRLIDEDLKGLSRDIVYVYAKFTLYKIFNEIRINYQFGKPAKTVIDFFRPKEVDEWAINIDSMELALSDIILNRCMTTFEIRIDGINNKLVDEKLIEAIDLVASIEIMHIDNYLYMLYNNVETRRVEEVGKFHGNKLKDRNKEKYTIFKKIVIEKYVCDKYYPNLKITETTLCNHYKQDSKSFNSWKNRNNGEYWDIIDESTEEEIKEAKEKVKTMFF